MSAPDSFSVCLRMSERNDRGLMLVPISQVLRVQSVKAGCQVTIGAPGSVLSGLATDRYIGGLLLIERDRFEAVRAEMEREAEVAPRLLAALVACVEMFGPEYEGVLEDCGEVVALTMARRAIADAAGPIEESQA